MKKKKYRSHYVKRFKHLMTVTFSMAAGKYLVIDNSAVYVLSLMNGSHKINIHVPFYGFCMSITRIFI